MPFSSPGDFSHPGTEPTFLVSLALAGGFFTTVPPGKHVNLDMLSPQSLNCVQLFVAQGLARLLCPWNFPGKNIAVGLHFLLQGIFFTQGSGSHLLCLLHWQADSLPPVQPAAAAAKSLQSCPTLCDPRDGSPPVSSVHGIFQARVLEWVAIAVSKIV